MTQRSKYKYKDYVQEPLVILNKIRYTAGLTTFNPFFLQSNFFHYKILSDFTKLQRNLQNEVFQEKFIEIVLTDEVTKLHYSQSNFNNRYFLLPPENEVWGR